MEWPKHAGNVFEWAKFSTPDSIKKCREQDLNHRSLLCEATPLPTEPQPLPQKNCLCLYRHLKLNFSAF